MRSGNGCCPGIMGNVIPNDFELNVRLTHAPEAESEGRSADRAWRTRASASVVRSVASSTGVAWPDATRTASAKERRSGVVRSEEHTSELQSRLHLVCRLLLEKKKTKKSTKTEIPLDTR